MSEQQLEIGPVERLEKDLSRFEEVYSPSEIDTFQRCRRKHHYAYDLRLGEPGPAYKADAGTVVHEAIATLWKTDGDVDAAVAQLKATYRKLFAWVAPTGFKIPFAYSEEHLLEVFLQYGLQVFREDKLPPLSREHIEIGFIVPILDPAGRDAPAILYGRMDRLGEEIDQPSRSIAPLDIKTTGSWGYDYKARFDPNLQGDLYAYVAREMYPDRPMRGFYIDGILIQATKIEFNRLMIDRRQADLDEFREETFWWIQQIRQARAEKRWPKSTNQCTAYGECAFRQVCTSHQLPNVIRTYPTRPPKGFHFVTAD